MLEYRHGRAVAAHVLGPDPSQGRERRNSGGLLVPCSRRSDVRRRNSGCDITAARWPPWKGARGAGPGLSLTVAHTAGAGAGMAIDAAYGSTSSTRPRLSGVIIAATIGNVLEWFDFLVYGYFALTIAEVFFPTGNATVSLLITFGAFGLSYVVRPLGAAIVGTYTDRAGRKAGLTLSIGLMMIGTILMVVTPGYATIGLAAPVIITLARLLQGFSVGGEFGSAVAFLVEHAGDRKGYSASWQWASTGIISIIVALFGVTLTTLLTHEQLVAWGWRVPYVFGLLVGPAGLYIRSRMEETPEFLAAEKPATVPIGDLLRHHPVPV